MYATTRVFVLYIFSYSFIFLYKSIYLQLTSKTEFKRSECININLGKYCTIACLILVLRCPKITDASLKSIGADLKCMINFNLYA